MKPTFLIGLIIYTLPVFSQATGDYSYVDIKARAIPVAQTYSTSSLASFITAHFKSDKEKIRAAYTWVTSNIRYDKDSMYAINTDADPQRKILAALRRRKGVCENYAAIFNDIAVKCGLRSYIINGYIKQSGTVNRQGHTWNAVYIDSAWSFCDPTWDEGFNGEARYFLISPERLIETHMPFDPLWQLLEFPVTHQRFYKSASPAAGQNKCHFNDSVHAYLALAELQKLESTASRMKQAGLVNDLLETQYRYIQMQIGISYEVADMELYNAAVADLNKASELFNAFVVYRNNHFIPSKPDSAISALLVPVEILLEASAAKAAKLGNVVENFQYDPGILKNRLQALSGRIREQKDFLKNYFATNLSRRDQLFYK